MDPNPHHGRTETRTRLFPVMDLSMPEVGPLPDVAYGRTEIRMKVHDVREVDLTIPYLVLTLRLAENAAAANGEALALDVLNLIDALSAYEKAIGGRGLRLHDKAADGPVLTLTLAPVAVDEAADRVNQLAGLLRTLAGRPETPGGSEIPVLEALARLERSPIDQCRAALARRPWSIEARVAMPA